jgi:hypothetical protein
MIQQPATEAKSKTITEHDLRKVLQRGKQRDTLGDKIDQALALINAVLDQLGCVYPSLHWLSSWRLSEGCLAISFNGGKDCVSPSILPFQRFADTQVLSYSICTLRSCMLDTIRYHPSWQ